MAVPPRPRDATILSLRRRTGVAPSIRRTLSGSGHSSGPSCMPRWKERASGMVQVAAILMGLWSAGCCRVGAQVVGVDELRVLVPLYARPDGDFWNHMVEAGHNSTVSFSVVINPNSGPGDLPEEVYTAGMNDLINAGVEVLCYVPTGFGSTDVSNVTADIDTYEWFYPSLCGGYFFDEGPGTENNTWKYTDYYSHAQAVSGPDSTVVVNPGIRPHDSLYNIGDRYALENPNMGGQVVITSFENNFEVFYDGSQQLASSEVLFPPRYLHDRYMHSILVYAAYFATLEDFLDFTVFQLYCANWGYVFFTDDILGDDGNPWDELPSYFPELLDAVGKAPGGAAECGTFAPTAAPTAAPTFAPLAPGETRPPDPTPSPAESTTVQPAGVGETRAPSAPPPTPAPTPSPTLSPTPSPTVHPTAMPTPVPTPVPTTPAPVREEGSGAPRRGTLGSSSLSSPATLLSGAVLLATTGLFWGAPL